ncbi:MAG: phospholipid/cholesterol/gamma-HCH transport system substrate-binding protein, partial [Actinomycetota bacterium]|nr:phospholipid/cholesterol/gamma-HCH transport system substrate-binding protein [Actinomycetota bacterium]
MISRQTKLQLLVFGLISILGLSYTGVRYAGLGRFFQDQGYVVSADFVDSGGIFKGAEVTNRGVPQGKVVSLNLQKDGVRVGLRMRPGTHIPKDVKAFVGNRSAVGEQYVDL